MHTYIHNMHAYIRTYLHTNIPTYVCMYERTHAHTHIPWIHICVSKTAGGGTSHKYTNIHNFYSVKYCKHFTKRYFRSSLHI